MKHVLFVCIHNSARSQMAEAFLAECCPGSHRAFSAGIEPGRLNPVVVQAMEEVGIDISGNATKSVDAIIASGERFDTVITVCDEASAERCPYVPGSVERLHWGFPDPSALTGTAEERLAGTRQIRDRIRSRVEAWCQGNPASGSF
ncbi:MAG: arsenate reductase ArsC [Verrucomicrobia bacterium]|nr:arsenate reductase ArsC [Verrucomicrobiota bacterium]